MGCEGWPGSARGSNEQRVRMGPGIRWREKSLWIQNTDMVSIGKAGTSGYLGN